MNITTTNNYLREGIFPAAFAEPFSAILYILASTLFFFIIIHYFYHFSFSKIQRSVLIILATTLLLYFIMSVLSHSFAPKLDARIVFYYLSKSFLILSIAAILFAMIFISSKKNKDLLLFLTFFGASTSCILLKLFFFYTNFYSESLIQENVFMYACVPLTIGTALLSYLKKDYWSKYLIPYIAICVFSFILAALLTTFLPSRSLIIIKGVIENQEIISFLMIVTITTSFLTLVRSILIKQSSSKTNISEMETNNDA